VYTYWKQNLESLLLVIYHNHLFASFGFTPLIVASVIPFWKSPWETSPQLRNANVQVSFHFALQLYRRETLLEEKIWTMKSCRFLQLVHPEIWHGKSRHFRRPSLFPATVFPLTLHAIRVSASIVLWDVLRCLHEF